MPKEMVTAELVTQAIVHRITTGQLAPGDRLPPVRKLAEELGSTATRSTKPTRCSSELGIIKGGDNGRQGYTVQRGSPAGTKPKSELIDYFYRQSIDLAWQEMAAGITARKCSTCGRAPSAKVFGHSKVATIFYECNDHDTIEMGRRLIEVLAMPVEYHNLPHFYDDPAAILKRYDLIITTYHHLAEISEVISQLGDSAEKSSASKRA